MTWTLIIFMLSSPSTSISLATSSAVSVPNFATQGQCLQAKTDMQMAAYEVNGVFKAAENSILAVCVQQTVAH